MRTVLVQMEGTSQSWALGPGETLSFGRGDVDVVLGDAGVSRQAGRIHAMNDFWMLTNHSPASTYVVENPEGGGEFVKIAPGRMEAPIPFEFARVVIPAAAGTVSFLVFAPEHHYAHPPGVVTGAAETQTTFPMDPTAKYFLVLVALCEPRLRDPSTPVIPPLPDVARRTGLSRSAVGFHIEYLASQKLRVKSPGGDAADKADWQRAALVSVALRFDLVREEHLRLLDAPG
ncbi:winged helix-turn-helix domain-containing protein [Nonomuraea sp. NPDC050556]|uniref:winged helix-turn-helix domain-containing protein n=1 Tax=Nonomuraea sp. NPDC050556 TaxID=3364369 RepID=UPI0037A3C68C